MNIFTFLTFFSFVIYVYLSIYVFHLDRSSRLNRVFVFMTAALAWKSFAYIFFHSAQTSEECFFWYKLSACGWNILPGVAIHYALILSEREDLLRRKLTYAIIYFPGVYYLANLLPGEYIKASDFVRMLNWSIVSTPENKWLLDFSRMYFAVASAICLYSTWRLMISSAATNRQRKQASILSKTLVFSAVTGITTDILLPVLNYRQLPQMAHIFIVFWILGIWYAITRYRFMTITPALASDEIISKIFDILILAGPDGSITRVNNHALISGGYVEEELAGRHISSVIRSEELDRAFFGSERTMNYLANADFITKTSGAIEINAACSRIRDEFGDVAGMVVCGHDLRPLNRILHEIAERRAAEEQLKAAHDRLELRVRERTAELASSNEQLRAEIEKRAKAEMEVLKMSKMESLGVLAGGIAHDFNNLLAGILNNISLAKLHAGGNGNVTEKLTCAEEVTLKAQALAAQFLTFSKGSVLIKKVVDIRDTLVKTVEFTLRGSRVGCRFDFADGLWAVEADAGQLNQVFTNLVINAMQVMPGGGMIEIAAANVMGEDLAGPEVTPGKFVRISFQDKGPGIAPEILPKIFDPYFTTKPDGSGLGLTSAFSVIRNHGGRIDVKSTPGAGAKFILFLPASERLADEKQATASAAISRFSCKVLVMDDEEAIRRSLKELFEFWGCGVSTAKDGGEAVEMFRAAAESGKPYDLLIFDFTVPGGMNGVQALAEIKKHRPAVRAILSSGYMKDQNMSDYQAAGFRYFLQKPYKAAELNAAIKKLLES